MPTWNLTRGVLVQHSLAASSSVAGESERVSRLWLATDYRFFQRGQGSHPRGHGVMWSQAEEEKVAFKEPDASWRKAGRRGWQVLPAPFGWSRVNARWTFCLWVFEWGSCVGQRLRHMRKKQELTAPRVCACVPRH